MSKELYDRGIALYVQAKYAEAIEYLDNVLVMDPKNSNAWYTRGSSKRMLGRHEEAIKDCDEAIKLDPKCALAWWSRGDSKRMLGCHEEAIKDCDEAIKLDPKYALVWWTRGESERRLDRHEEAIKDCDEAIKLDPSCKLAWLARGESKYRLTRYEEAIKDCDEAIKLGPKIANAWLVRGESKYRLAQYEEAIQDCDEVIKLDPNYTLAWRIRGAAKRELGRYNEAIQDLNEALKLDPNNKFAKEGLEKAKEQMKSTQNTSLSQPNSNNLSNGKKDSLTAVTVKPKSQEVPTLVVSVSNSPVFNHAINVSMAIPKEQLNVDCWLGGGTFGEVHKGIWSPTSLFKLIVAIKQLKHQAISTRVLEDFKREVEIQSKLDSPGVVKLYGITVEQPYCMIIEFMEQGSLRDILDAQKPEELQWKIRIQMAVNMSRGLKYLHSQNPIIIHGDLKSLNILVNAKGEAKLADFGLAALKTESRSKEYAGGNTKNKGPKGSLLWVAPELFRMNAKRTIATDIFSLAVVFWELASHLFPYENANGSVQLIQSWVEQGQREAFDERTPNTPKEYIELTQRCWDAKPESRPSAENVAVGLEKLYSSTQSVPTMFSPNSQPQLSPKPIRKPGVNSAGYVANTVAKFTVPSPKSPTPLKKVPPKKAVVKSGYLAKSAAASSQASPAVLLKRPLPKGPVGSSSEVPQKMSYLGNMYK